MSVVFDSPAALVDAGEVELGTSAPVRVTQAMIDGFAEATGDHQWIHVDPERAAAGPFGTTIAHGYLTMSLLAPFAEELLVVHGSALAINAGSDRVRFIDPVRVDSEVRASAVLVSAEPSGPGIRARVRTTVTADGADRPALVAETLTIYVPA
jgi:acyl dehydratase